MNDFLKGYKSVVGGESIHKLKQLAEPLRGARVIHVNSTSEGGGVAEILTKLIPFQRALDIDAHWRVIKGNPEFFECTKKFHNALQGSSTLLSDDLIATYEKTNAENAEILRNELEQADFVFIHDPQPAAMIRHITRRAGFWIWRCHIDVSHPYRAVWKFVRDIVSSYDASIFSLPEFAQKLPHPQFLVTPCIDPLSDKNIPLPRAEVDAVFDEFNLDPERPIVTQVSRFDRFKDPLGVIQACYIARRMAPLQLVLAGGGAEDDPESGTVLQEVEEAAAGDPDIRVLVLPPDAHRTINALQRASTLVIQKSLREGFGLTVTEAMWKKKPVIGGDTGGIRLQVVNHHTGFLVRTPEGAALRMRYLLHERERLKEMGEEAHHFVRQNFLLPRLVEGHLAIMLRLRRGKADRIELEAG